MKKSRFKFPISVLIGVLFSSSLFAGVQVTCVEKGGEASSRLSLTKGKSVNLQFRNYFFEGVTIKNKRVVGHYRADPDSFLTYGSILFDLPAHYDELSLNQSFDVSLKHIQGVGRQPTRNSVILMECKLESVYPRADCERDLKNLQTAEVVGSTQESKNFSKTALKVARSNFGAGYFYAVEYLQYGVNGSHKGARVTISDDRDPGQANVQVYYFMAHQLTHNPVLIAIEDQPHCCAPDKIEWICQNPEN